MLWGAVTLCPSPLENRKDSKLDVLPVCSISCVAVGQSLHCRSGASVRTWCLPKHRTGAFSSIHVGRRVMVQVKSDAEATAGGCEHENSRGGKQGALVPASVRKVNIDYLRCWTSLQGHCPVWQRGGLPKRAQLAHLSAESASLEECLP